MKQKHEMFSNNAEENKSIKNERDDHVCRQRIERQPTIVVFHQSNWNENNNKDLTKEKLSQTEINNRYSNEMYS